MAHSSTAKGRGLLLPESRSSFVIEFLINQP
jgi:hypothetical protein